MTCMRLHRGDKRVGQQACELLVHLAKVSESRRQIVEEGGVAMFVEGMMETSGGGSGCLHWCGTLLGLVAEAAEFRAEIAEADGVEAVFKWMRECGERGAGLRTLATLAEEDKCSARIVAGGWIKEVIKLMQESKMAQEAAGIREAGCSLLARLAMSGSSASEEIVNEGGILVVVEVLAEKPNAQ
eukprot:1518391-Rhodomonas_salina.1